MLKVLGLAGAGAVVAVYLSGGLGGYPRTVDGSPDELMAELADLDIREQPGNPGSTAESAGGTEFRGQHTN